MSALRPRPGGCVGRGAGWEPPRAIGSRSLLDAARSYGAEGWPDLPVAGGASAYGVGALGREPEAVRGRAVGQRNGGLDRAAFCLGRLVGGGELADALVFGDPCSRGPRCRALRVGGRRHNPKRIASGDGGPAAGPRRELRMAAAPEAEAAIIRQAWVERTRPRRREGVAGVHPAG